MRRHLCAFALVVLFAAVSLRAERLPVRVYGLTHGLPSTFVDHIAADSRGFLWFSTRDGLARFDGSRFVTYGTDDGLPVPQVSFLLETSRGEYWVATNGGGVCRMDTGARTTPPQPATAEAPQRRSLFHCVSLRSAPADRVNVLAEDRKGRVWAGTDEGLFRLDAGDRGEPVPVSIALGAAWGDGRRIGVSALRTGEEDDLWVGTGRGLVRVLADGRLARYPAQSRRQEQPVRDIALGPDGRIWVAFPNSLLVLCSTSSCAQPVRWIDVPDGEVGESALVVSRDGRAWIGTNQGLLGYDGARFRRYEAAHGLPERLVSEIAEDRQGDLWIASLAGVYRLSRDGLLTYDHHDGLAASRIHSIFEDTVGAIFVVGDDWVISRFDGNRFVSVKPRVQGIPRWSGQLAFLDRGNAWWILDDKRLGRYAARSRIADLDGRPPPLVYSHPNRAARQYFARLFEDARGDVWWGIGGEGGGLGRWDRSTNAFVTNPGVPASKSRDRPSAFGEDASGALWVGLAEGGLMRSTGAAFEPLSGDGMPGGTITAIHRDTAGRLWIGSNRDGLTRVDDPTAKHPRFIRYGAADGLSSGNVRCITSDAAGTVYVGTVRGVDVLDPRLGVARRYSTDDGLANGFVTAALHDARGRLWFGTLDGLSRLVPAAAQATAPPSTWIESWRVNGVTQPVSHLGQESIKGVVLGPNQREIEITFSAIGFAEAGRLRFQYRLDAADRDWTAATPSRSVHYSRLAPGRYRFQVRALTADGVPSTRAAALEFDLRPPISQRWWFRTSLLFVAALAVFGAHRSRVARLIAMERVRMRIAADLHDDIGGSLSRISIQSEVASRELAAGGVATAGRLDDIAASARGLVDALSDVVWSVDPRKDDLASVFRRIRAYAHDVLVGRGVRWRYVAADGLEHVKVDPAARRHLFLLLKEALTNAARHGGATTVSLHVELEDGALRAELRDDGRGFEPAANGDASDSGGHGLASMQARAERLRAELTIDSSPGIGTRLLLRMPLSRRRRIAMLLPPRRSKTT